MAKANYLVTTWQGLIQQIVLYVGRGYHYAQLFEFPEKKRPIWPDIDKKLLAKFDSDKSRFQRARQKNKGLINFVYLRWEQLGIVLHTQGEPAPGVCLDGERFLDVRKRPLRLQVGKETIFVIRFEKKVEVCLASDTYQGIKAVIFDLARSRSKLQIKNELKKLSGLPGYSGVNEQKKQLARFARKQLGKHQVKVEKKEFNLWLGKKMVTVFSDDVPNS